MISTDSPEYLHRVQPIYITLHNPTNRSIQLPTDAPWIVKGAKGNIVAVGTPRKNQAGARLVPRGLFAVWIWDQKIMNGPGIVEPGAYQVELPTRSDGILSYRFQIMSARPWMKRLARYGRDGCVGFGASVSAAGFVAAFIGPVSWAAIGVGEGASLALGWYLDSYATDPQQQDHTRSVAVQPIPLQLPEARTELDTQAHNFAIAVARVVETLSALTSAIESYDLAEAAGEPGRASLDMHRVEIENFAAQLAERTTFLITNLDAFSDGIKSSGLPLSISPRRLRQFQDRLLLQGLPKEGVDESALLRQFRMSAREIEGTVEWVVSIARSDALQVLVEYEDLRSVLQEIADTAKILPQEFRAR